MKARTLIRSAATAAIALFAGAGCDQGANTITQARCPCTLELISGDGQTASPGGELSDQLVVRVTDTDGVGVLGALVLWQVTSGGGNIEPECIPQTCPNGGTDPGGLNRAEWTLGNTPGVQTVEVSTLVANEVLTFTAQAESL